MYLLILLLLNFQFREKKHYNIVTASTHDKISLYTSVYLYRERNNNTNRKCNHFPAAYTFELEQFYFGFS